MILKIVLFQITLLIGVHVESASKPNIILLIADDLGWNDVGFHGSNEIPTPNIDALAYSGIILNRHYTMPTCTPSRSALMTGKYPIRLGMQGPPIKEGSPISLPLNEKLLPQYLKDIGYVSRLVGKWHLGYYKTQCIPTHRGFDSHFGYYNGWTRYNDSVSVAKGNNQTLIGIDAWNDHQHAGERFKNNYNTDVFTDEAVNIIKTHDTEKPLFLDLSYAAVHAIPNSALQVRDIVENDKKFAHIKDKNRRMFAGVLSTIDESIPRIMQALHDKMMLSNSIIIFISDNGGATEDSRGLFGNYASNWPLRGMKSSVTEGGVRGVAAIWSPLIKTPNRVTDKLIHLTDWLPTFYAAAGGNTSDLGNIDGINQWPYLTDITTKPPRKEILINIDEVKGEHAIIDGNWKLIKVVKSSIKYAGSTGREEEYRYNMSSVITSRTRQIISSYVNKTNDELKKTFWQLRNRAKIDKYCENRINELDINGNETKCFEKGCLFNIKKDPCEYKDLSEEHKNHYHKLESELEKYRKQLVKQQENTFDPKSNPKYFDGYWSPWVPS